MKLPGENNLNIIETVTDDYGIAKKFSDGTMLVTQKYTATIESWDTWGNVYVSHTVTPPDYPVEFAEEPTVTYGLHASSGDAWLSTWASGNIASTICSEGIQICRGTEPSSSSRTYTISVIAIGKWK